MKKNPHKTTIWNLVIHHLELISTSQKWCAPLIARFMGPTWGPSGAERTQIGTLWDIVWCNVFFVRWIYHLSSGNITWSYQVTKYCFIAKYILYIPRLFLNQGQLEVALYLLGRQGSILQHSTLIIDRVVIRFANFNNLSTGRFAQSRANI